MNEGLLEQAETVINGEFEELIADNIRAIDLTDTDEYVAEVAKHNNLLKRLLSAHNADMEEDRRCLVGFHQLRLTKDKRIAELMEVVGARGELIDELEGALLRQTVIVRYYAGDYVCECGWTVDDDDPQTKFNYCPGCGSKLDWTEVEK